MRNIKGYGDLQKILKQTPMRKCVTTVCLYLTKFDIFVANKIHVILYHLFVFLCNKINLLLLYTLSSLRFVISSSNSCN